MIDPRDIHSLTSFQRNAREHIERMKRTARPEVLTVNGKAELVLLAPEVYRRLASRGGPALRPAPPARQPPDRIESDDSVDPIVEAYERHVDRTLLRENLRRTPEERLRGLMALQRLADEAGRAGRAARNTPADA